MSQPAVATPEEPESPHGGHVHVEPHADFLAGLGWMAFGIAILVAVHLDSVNKTNLQGKRLHAAAEELTAIRAWQDFLDLVDAAAEQRRVRH